MFNLFGRKNRKKNPLDLFEVPYLGTNNNQPSLRISEEMIREICMVNILKVGFVPGMETFSVYFHARANDMWNILTLSDFPSAEEAKVQADRILSAMNNWLNGEPIVITVDVEAFNKKYGPKAA
jgi:hypothetical protein